MRWLKEKVRRQEEEELVELLVKLRVDLARLQPALHRAHPRVEEGRLERREAVVDRGELDEAVHAEAVDRLDVEIRGLACVEEQRRRARRRQRRGRTDARRRHLPQLLRQQRRHGCWPEERRAAGSGERGRG